MTPTIKSLGAERLIFLYPQLLLILIGHWGTHLGIRESRRHSLASDCLQKQVLVGLLHGQVSVDSTGEMKVWYRWTARVQTRRVRPRKPLDCKMKPISGVVRGWGGGVRRAPTPRMPGSLFAEWQDLQSTCFRNHAHTHVAVVSCWAAFLSVSRFHIEILGLKVDSQIKICFFW